MSKKNLSLENAVQINDGLKQTSSDGAALAFDSKYGIMFCAYMPGFLGDYGESRGKISLSYFPASQPTNIKFLDVSFGNEEYVPNIISLGNGKVRILYEKFSRADGDHPVCYKDFDFLTQTLSEEKIVMLNKQDGSVIPLGISETFKYIEVNGYFDHRYVKTEQHIIGGCTYFRGEDGYLYGALSTEVGETVLYRSKDDHASVEFFAVYPRRVQYEFDYKILNGIIYAIYRTDRAKDAIGYSVSKDMGKTWTEPEYFKDSIQCRPRLIIHENQVLTVYNYYNSDSGNRPRVIDGRTAIRIHLGENPVNDDTTMIADLHSKYGVVNIAVCDVLGDVYLVYSTSVSALEYQNGTPYVRGKDALRYLKLDL